ncbi:DUF6338 family protein [Oribacterium sp. HCP28S3_H8]|uniref:DUF6338 family protein n=1 Tax=Oribacterium sp. HCP28S3_H8 TaxID=3438945 RepID=UPI003F8C9550
MISNPETIIYTFLFLVPGYVISEIISSFLPEKEIDTLRKTLQCLMYSVINISLWYWLFRLIANHLSSDTSVFWLAMVLAYIVTSIITGVCLGIVRLKNFPRRLLSIFKVNVQHPAPTAWDYRFSKDECCWVEVILNNGDTIKGYFGSDSLASSQENYHDLYLEKLYVMGSETWKLVDRTAGVWINPSEIRYIKFYKTEEK